MKKYRIEGSCKQCGWCCSHIMHMTTFKSKKARDEYLESSHVAWLKENFKVELYAYRGTRVIEVIPCRCKSLVHHFDRARGDHIELCAKHHKKPSACSDFPGDEEGLSDLYLALTAIGIPCGYKVINIRTGKEVRGGP